MTSSKINLDRLASLGQEVLGKAAQNPAAAKLIQSAVQLRDQVDDLAKRVSGLEKLEKRVDGLEKKLAKLEKAQKKPPRPKKAAPPPPPAAWGTRIRSA